MNATWIITTFVLIDTAMTNLDHQTDVRAKVPDSEVVTVALVAAKYFANNHRIALDVMQKLQYLSGSISHSRLNRRLHALRDWMSYLPELLSDMISTNTYANLGRLLIVRRCIDTPKYENYPINQYLRQLKVA